MNDQYMSESYKMSSTKDSLVENITKEIDEHYSKNPIRSGWQFSVTYPPPNGWAPNYERSKYKFTKHLPTGHSVRFETYQSVYDAPYTGEFITECSYKMPFEKKERPDPECKVYNDFARATHNGTLPPHFYSRT